MGLFDVYGGMTPMISLMPCHGIKVFRHHREESFHAFLQLARTKTINSDPNWQYVNIVNYLIGNLPPRQREFIWLYSSLGIQSSVPFQQIIVLVAIKGSAKPCAIYKTRLSIILSWGMMIQPDSNTNVLYILIIVLWLKYCRHGVKHRSINQSILLQTHL